MDMEKMREGGIAACAAAAFGLAWLLTRETQVGEYAALGAMLAGAIALWRVAAGLATRSD